MNARIGLFALFALLLGFTTQRAAAQESTKVEVILVMASNSGKGVDSSLKPYAGNLQRIFNFNSFQQRDRKTLNISIPGGTSTNLYGGTRLRIGLQAIKDGRLPADIDWSRGRDRLLKTLVRLNPGTPAIVGGPQAEDNTGSYLLIINWKK
ncbi:MAG: hypothetical protein AAFX93_08035 [Verrucomicrobiota bacterium]